MQLFQLFCMQWQFGQSCWPYIGPTNLNQSQFRLSPGLSYGDWQRFADICCMPQCPLWEEPILLSGQSVKLVAHTSADEFTGRIQLEWVQCRWVQSHWRRPGRDSRHEGVGGTTGAWPSLRLYLESNDPFAWPHSSWQHHGNRPRRTSKSHQ